MRVEAFVDYLLVEIDNQTQRIYHSEFRPWVESQSVVIDSVLNGEHNQTEDTIDYYVLLNDEPNLKDAIKNYLDHEAVHC